MKSEPVERPGRRYEIRPMHSDDLEPVAELLHGASRPRHYLPTPELARKFLSGSLETDGEHNLVATCGDQVVGYTCSLRRRGWVAGCGPTALHPDHGDSGLDAQMVMRTIQASTEACVGLLRHPVALRKSMFDMVYRRMKLDFTGDTYIRLQRAPECDVPPPGEHEAIPIEPSDLKRIVVFDRERFVNADRTPDYLLMLEHMGGRGWALERGGELSGFVFAAPGMDIGPLAARDPAAAVDALRVATAFNQERGLTNGIHISAADRFLLEEALRLGYVCREAMLLFERSFDGRTQVRSPRGTYCIGLLGVP